MRTRLMRHYYCDFCRKVKHHKSAMVKHESHCTKNPNRVCGMCKMAGLVQVPMVELLKCGPEKELIDMTSGCPACSLAAMRQGEWCHPLSDFDWKRASKDWLNKYGKEKEYA